MKRNPRKTLKNKLDKLWSLIIRAKYPNCIVCGNSPTQAHHCISRKAQSMGVRWMINNGVGLCVVCHLYKLHGSQGDKQFLDRYLVQLNLLISPEDQENIHQVAHQINKYSIQDMEDMVSEFEKILKGE